MKRLEALVKGEDCTAIEPIFNPKQTPKQSYQQAHRGLSKKSRRQ